MKCPYCREDIKDGAVVCRHCGRDFFLVKPLLERLISVERAVAEIGDTVQGEGGPGWVPGPLVGFLAVVLGVLLTSGYLLVSIAPPAPRAHPALPKILAIVLPPLLLGVMVGLARRPRSVRLYLVGGLAPGVLNFVAIGLIIKSFRDATFRWVLALSTFGVGQSLLFFVSALLANSLLHRWSGAGPGAARAAGAGSDAGAGGGKLSTTIGILIQVLGLVTSLFGTLNAASRLLGGAKP